MKPLLLGLGLFLLVWVMHVVAWKIRIPKAGRRTLFLLFLGALPVGIATAIFAAAAPPAGIVLASALYLALALAYLALYVALEGDSPTLSLTGILAAAEPAGLKADELRRAAGFERHVRSRLDLMVTDAMAELAGERYRITDKGRRLVGYYDWYDRIAGTVGKSGKTT